MEEASLGDKIYVKLLQKSCKSRQNLQSTNTRRINRLNKDAWLNGSMKILVVLASLISVLISEADGQSPPPNYNYKKLPDTSFTCEDKATGGYYADPEAGCQMFHVCLRVSEEQINDFKFLCPNNTVFDQQNFICTNWWEIDCKQSTRYYNKNDLFRVQDETTTAEPEYVEQPGYEEIVYEYVDPEPVEKNTVVHKIPESVVRENPERKRRITTTTTTFAPTNLTFKPTTLPLTASTPWHSTTIAPQVTTVRKRHRFSYQSEDNIGKPAYQPNYGYKEEQPSSESQRKAEAEPDRISKSFDTQKEPRLSQRRRKRPTSNRLISSQSDKSEINLDTIKETTSSVNVSQNTTKAPRMKALRRKSNRRQKTAQPSKPKEKHKEFSNFRFYKTAFGRSYSSDDYLYSSTTPRSIKRRARFRRPRRLRTGRTASRNTRYSKYAR